MHPSRLHPCPSGEYDGWFCRCHGYQTAMVAVSEGDDEHQAAQNAGRALDLQERTAPVDVADPAEIAAPPKQTRPVFNTFFRVESLLSPRRTSAILLRSVLCFLT